MEQRWGDNMPINDDLSIEYHIPEDIKKKIPEYFYQAFFGELISVFGFQCLVPINKRPSLYSKQIEDYLISISESGGWYAAFKQSCIKLDLKWLIEYYESLSWYDSDLFDNEIVNEIIIHFVNDRQTNNSYYKHLFQKNGYNLFRRRNEKEI